MTVRFSIEDHVARITIDRPDRMNAIDTATQTRLEEIWDEIEANSEVRCVVLTGSGEKAFSAGADLKDDTGMSGVDYWKDLSGTGFKRIALRRTLNVPVIARINGLALGGGLEMAMGCDILIAADTARFGLPEAKVGRLPLDGGIVTLPRLIPRNIAVGMMMTGRMMSADDMARYGLVNAVVPADELDAEVEAWVKDILSAAPLSIKAIKAIVRSTGEMSIHDAYTHETPELLAALNSEDANEGVQAFREKRAPVWQGK
ncbi:enoyl-CoA hydratase-related protein [Thalassorhabdomicrobium marinisediminis]|uniref:Crotonase n=1 Tax=Thalassorhabdomicrobium marinisediminis TaxID=2170577 RepID=A0A2T7FZ12_9RHOB|nr:enoyl-CoA hydratase-related protein [Thalassorhabdomicrobium marinisediminis]PVA07401.1 crotonase [Thalassorhabdomicrobium marinisediminis]